MPVPVTLRSALRGGYPSAFGLATDFELADQLAANFIRTLADTDSPPARDGAGSDTEGS